MFGCEPLEVTAEQRDRAWRALAALALSDWGAIDDLRHTKLADVRGAGPFISWPKVGGPAGPAVAVIGCTSLDFVALREVLTAAKSVVDAQDEAARRAPKGVKELLESKANRLRAAESHWRVRLVPIGETKS